MYILKFSVYLNIFLTFSIIVGLLGHGHRFAVFCAYVNPLNLINSLQSKSYPNLLQDGRCPKETHAKEKESKLDINRSKT